MNYESSEAKLAQNDLNPDELVIFGGEYYHAKRSNGIKIGHYPRLIAYNIKNNEWKTVGERSEYLITGHNSVIHNGSLMIFGGGANVGSENEVQFMNSSLYVLNLHNPSWEKRYVLGLIISSSGCLEYYNDHLLYGFGLRKEVYSKMQIINLNNYALVNRIPSVEEM